MSDVPCNTIGWFYPNLQSAIGSKATFTVIPEKLPTESKPSKISEKQSPQEEKKEVIVEPPQPYSAKLFKYKKKWRESTYSITHNFEPLLEEPKNVIENAKSEPCKRVKSFCKGGRHAQHPEQLGELAWFLNTIDPLPETVDLNQLSVSVRAKLHGTKCK